MSKMMVIAPHPDDESIGCGGMICLHQARGNAVVVVFLTSGERGIENLPPEEVRMIREKEAHEATNILGVTRIDFLRLPDLALDENMEAAARRLAPLLEEHHPDLIFLPHPDENHPDHRVALPLVRASFNRVPSLLYSPQLWGYEVWTPMREYGWTEDISRYMKQKLRAIRCYRSQLQTFRYDRGVRGLNQYRGCLAAGSHYAEVFQYLECSFPSRLDSSSERHQHE